MSRRPVFIPVLVMALSGMARADELEKSEDTPAASWSAEWSVDRFGTIQPTLLIEPLADTTVEYWINGRVRIGSNEVVWKQGPFDARPATMMEVPVQIPEEAYWSDKQEVAMADLLVHVDAYSEGAVLESIPAPAARVAWPDGPERSPFILDHRTATAEAPLGILGMSVVEEDDGDPTGGVPADMVSP